VGFCEHGNELSGCIDHGKSCDHLTLSKESACEISCLVHVVHLVLVPKFLLYVLFK
jgi:hypothetical protein